MRRIRLIPALLLCLALLTTSATAYAAPKEATTKPTIKITLPKGAFRGGVGGDLTVTPSVPGFLTLRLLTKDGGEIATLLDNAEVHTKANTIEFAASDENGDPLSEGSYVLSATMVNQYGTESKETTAEIKVGASRPTLTVTGVSSTKKFKVTVDAQAEFHDKAATIMLSLTRTNPQAMYIDDFEDIELKKSGSGSVSLDIMDDNPFPSGVGYYKITGEVNEDNNNISSNEIEYEFVIDVDGVAYPLDEVSDDVLDAIDEAIEQMTGTSSSTKTEKVKENAVEKNEKAVEEVIEEATEEVTEESEGSSTKKAETPKNEAKKQLVASDETEYGAGDSEMGDDGLEIGVGVSDVADQVDAGYWTLTADASDEEIWAALTRAMIGVDVSVQESAYIYDSTEEGRKRLGTVSGISQGLNVIKEREDGWSLVEAFRNEDGAFIRGYIRTNKLRMVNVNQDYGIVIDKAAQKLTVYKAGEPIGSCDISTGLATPKYLHRETPAGEFILATRRGTIEYYNKGFSKYTIRINGNYHLCEIPTTKKNGSDFSILEDSLGEKATRGHICVAHDASSDGGINAEWIWDLTEKNRDIKILIFDDKDRDEVPVGE